VEEGRRKREVGETDAAATSSEPEVTRETDTTTTTDNVKIVDVSVEEKPVFVEVAKTVETTNMVVEESGGGGEGKKRKREEEEEEEEEEDDDDDFAGMINFDAGAD